MILLPTSGQLISFGKEQHKDKTGYLLGTRKLSHQAYPHASCTESDGSSDKDSTYYYVPFNELRKPLEGKGLGTPRCGSLNISVCPSQGDDLSQCPVSSF